MANNSNLSKRAALRQAQEADERAKRNKRIMGFGAALAALVVVVVLAIVIVQAVGNRTTLAEEQLTPPNGTEKYGILLQGETPTEDKPHLIVWEDFQCPACANVEAIFGPLMGELVADGSITVETRSATFLDRGRDDGPSHRAAIAAAASDEVGHYEVFHRLLFENQSSGYSDQALRNDIPAAAGITGEDLDRYLELYGSRAYNDFVVAANEMFATDGIQATPAYIVSGMRLDMAMVEPTADGLLTAVTEAWEAGGKMIEDTPEPYQPR